MPELSAYFQSGGLVDSVLNLGLPAPIDVQVSGMNLDKTYAQRQRIANQIRQLNGVSDVLIPQDIDYPALQLNIDRERASLVGLSQKEVVDNVITALTSNQMIAPSYWVDPKSGNDYMLTVQYPGEPGPHAQRPEADSHPGGRQSRSPRNWIRSPTSRRSNRPLRSTTTSCAASSMCTWRRRPKTLEDLTSSIDKVIAQSQAAGRSARATFAARCRACALHSRASASA